jgi:hypothetical protein
VEGDEGFSFTLSSPVRATIADGSAAGTIHDNDAVLAVSTALTAKVVKTTSRIKVQGLLEPAAAGLSVKVTLLKKVGDAFKKVASKTVVTKLLADRDGDGKLDASYLARFAKPGAGRYRARVSFAGTAAFLASQKVVGFRI